MRKEGSFPGTVGSRGSTPGRGVRAYTHTVSAAKLPQLQLKLLNRNFCFHTQDVDFCFDSSNQKRKV